MAKMIRKHKVTVAHEVARFEREELPTRAEATRKYYPERLRWLTRHFGDCRTAEVDPKALQRQAGLEKWKDGTRRLTLTVCQVFFRWAGRADFTLDMPPWGARDERCVISKDELTAALNLCNGDFGPLVQWLFLTGCRPKEGRLLSADMVDWQGGKVVIEDHKTRKKTRKPKTVYLSEPAMDILKGQRVKYDGGNLFRDSRGGQFTEAAVQLRWRRVRDALGLRSQVVTYGLRHSFATHLLERGKTSRDVAELLGHTSTTMVEKVYGHFVNQDRLREVTGSLVD